MYRGVTPKFARPARCIHQLRTPYLHCVLHPLSRLDVAHSVPSVGVLCAYWAVTDVNALSLSVGDRTVAVDSFGVEVCNACESISSDVRTHVSVHELSCAAAVTEAMTLLSCYNSHCTGFARLWKFDHPSHDAEFRTRRHMYI